MSAAARHAEIARRYAWHDRNRRDGSAPLTITTLRTAELERIFRGRFGGTFPDTSHGRYALVLMAEHHAKRNDLDTVVGWITARAPWTAGEMAERIARQAASETRRWTADGLAWIIGLTVKERAYLKIRTIGAVGTTSASRLEARKVADQQRKELARRAAGVKPRAQYEAESAAQTKPWEAFGWSRSKWHRLGRPKPPSRETGPSTIKREIYPTADTPVSRSMKAPGLAPSAHRASLRSAGLITVPGKARTGEKMIGEERYVAVR